MNCSDNTLLHIYVIDPIVVLFIGIPSERLNTFQLVANYGVNVLVGRWQMDFHRRDLRSALLFNSLLIVHILNERQS